MQKNIVLFSLIVTIIIVLNCNLVYSEPIEDNIDENIDIKITIIGGKVVYSN